MKNRILYVGLDVHKNTTDVATAAGRSNGKVRFYGKISSSLDALSRLIKKSSKVWITLPVKGCHGAQRNGKLVISWRYQN